MTYACLHTLSYSDNKIGARGAHALAESLKQNTTLTELNLTCMLKTIIHACTTRYSSRPMRAYSYLVNNICDEGARALAESLKQNTTLTELNLRGMLELHELLFVVTR